MKDYMWSATLAVACVGLGAVAVYWSWSRAADGKPSEAAFWAAMAFFIGVACGLRVLMSLLQWDERTR